MPSPEQTIPAAVTSSLLIMATTGSRFTQSPLKQCCCVWPSSWMPPVCFVIRRRRTSHQLHGMDHCDAGTASGCRPMRLEPRRGTLLQQQTSTPLNVGISCQALLTAPSLAPSAIEGEHLLLCISGTHRQQARRLCDLGNATTACHGSAPNADRAAGRCAAQLHVPTAAEDRPTSQWAHRACSPRSRARSAASASTVAQASGGTLPGLAPRSVATPELAPSASSQERRMLPATKCGVCTAIETTLCGRLGLVPPTCACAEYPDHMAGRRGQFEAIKYADVVHLKMRGLQTWQHSCRHTCPEC